jgi:hypothetical protein
LKFQNGVEMNSGDKPETNVVPETNVS